MDWRSWNNGSSGKLPKKGSPEQGLTPTQRGAPDAHHAPLRRLRLYPQELQALFRYAREQDVERGGHYDARSAAIIIWSHHWAHPATREESETIGTFYVH
jgi:hypothetical protein